MRGRLTPTALALSSLALAVLADALFCGAAWGINVGLWAALVALGAVGLTGADPTRLTPTRKALAASALLFALLFAFRDSNALKTANGVALAFCLGALILPEGGLRDSSVSRLLYAPLTSLAALGSGFYRLFEATREERQATPDAQRRGKAVLRGLLIAAPLLLVFGGLFASADAVFRADAERLLTFDLDFDALASRFWTFLFALTFAGGLLYRLLLVPAFVGPPVAPLEGTERRNGRIGIIEIGIVLGSLVLLFGSFVAVQFRYLFGARGTVEVTKGLSYAEYARSGFFELVWVAALALMVLLGTDSLLKRERPGDETAYRWLGRALVALVSLIVVSALMRMRLYTVAFGLTELRIYSTVFMVWLTLAFAWLLATTLNGRPQRCAFGMLAAGLLVILGTNLVNPDGLIVRTNLSKPRADFAYLQTLSDDAALALWEMDAAVPPAHRAEVERLVQARRRSAAQSDWRELNLARWSLAR